MFPHPNVVISNTEKVVIYFILLSIAKPGQEGLFNIRAFPEQMLQVNNNDWLTGVDATDDTWQNICMTWRASDGENRLIGHVNNIPTMQFLTGISGNPQSKLYMLSLTVYKIMHCGLRTNMPYYRVP